MFKKYDVFWDQENQVYQVRTKTAIFTIEFDNNERKIAFNAILDTINDNQRIRLKALIKELKKEHREEIILVVLEKLRDYQLLSEEYFIDLAEYKGESLNQNELDSPKSILILGQSNLSKKLAQIIKVDSTYLLQSYTFGDALDKSILNSADFVVVDGHEWNPNFLKRLNKELVELKKPWLYMPGIEGSNIKVGPLFLGGELGCLNCYQKRVESNDNLFSYNQSYLKYLESGKKTAKPDYHPIYPYAISMLCNLAMSEIDKFFKNWTIPQSIGKLISMDLATYEVKEHHLLKIPHCGICKPSVQYNLAPWLEPIV